MGLNDYESSAAAKETHQRITEKVAFELLNKAQRRQRRQCECMR